MYSLITATVTGTVTVIVIGAVTVTVITTGAFNGKGYE